MLHASQLVPGLSITLELFQEIPSLLLPINGIVAPQVLPFAYAVLAIGTGSWNPGYIEVPNHVIPNSDFHRLRSRPRETVS